MRNATVPSWPEVPSRRAAMSQWSALTPNVMRCFSPFITYVSPSRRTVVRMSAPVPAVASVSVNATSLSPATLGFTTSSICSGVA